MHMRICKRLALAEPPSTSTNYYGGSSNDDSKLPPATQVQIPYCYRFITPSDENWWSKHLQHFPPGYSPCNVIQTQRVPPVPRNIREFLIDRYCPEKLIAEIKKSGTNEDCLIRPYLGKRRTNKSDAARLSRFKAFSLRNYPLHLDQMQELDIPDTDIETYAKAMAETLALLHWVAGVDGNDVEFVLASPPASSEKSEGVMTDPILGTHSMWLLDFDLCRALLANEEGVRQAVTAFIRNDPFFPRPWIDGRLWDVFRKEYLRCTEEVAMGDSEIVGLSKMFVDEIERYSRT